MEASSAHAFPDRLKLDEPGRTATFVPSGKGKVRATLTLEDPLARMGHDPVADVNANSISALLSEQLPTRAQALVAWYALCRLIDSADGIARISVTELLDLEGKTRLGAAERDRRVQDVYEPAFRLASAWRLAGEVSHHGPEDPSGAVHFEFEPLFIFQSPIFAQHWRRVGFTVVDSSLTKKLRKKRDLLAPIGRLQKVARIPTRQAWGDIAQSIAIAASFMVRANANRLGHNPTRVTRRTLIQKFPPERDFAGRLSGTDPGRVRDTWESAIKELRQRGIVDIRERCTAGRVGWSRRWLDETVEVVALDEWSDGVSAILEGKLRRRSSTSKPPLSDSKTCGSASQSRGKPSHALREFAGE
jgi:hypothetical protein